MLVHVLEVLLDSELDDTRYLQYFSVKVQTEHIFSWQKTIDVTLVIDVLLQLSLPNQNLVTTIYNAEAFHGLLHMNVTNFLNQLGMYWHLKRMWFRVDYGNVF